jgi:hypothetical protein
MDNQQELIRIADQMLRKIEKEYLETQGLDIDFGQLNLDVKKKESNHYVILEGDDENLVNEHSYKSKEKE